MAKHSPPLRVLVVDDEALIRWALVETLAMLDMRRSKPETRRPPFRLS